MAYSIGDDEIMDSFSNFGTNKTKKIEIDPFDSLKRSKT
jgi:hypothetical protein